jgi:hypothetical protein
VKRALTGLLLATLLLPLLPSEAAGIPAFARKCDVS